MYMYTYLFTCMWIHVKQKLKKKNQIEAKGASQWKRAYVVIQIQENKWWEVYFQHIHTKESFVNQIKFYFKAIPLHLCMFCADFCFS